MQISTVVKQREQYVFWQTSQIREEESYKVPIGHSHKGAVILFPLQVVQVLKAIVQVKQF